MDGLLLVVSTLLISLVLLQSAKADAASSVITGGNSDLFSNRKERGGEAVLTKVTAVVGFTFFMLCVFMSF